MFLTPSDQRAVRTRTACADSGLSAALPRKRTCTVTREARRSFEALTVTREVNEHLAPSLTVRVESVRVPALSATLTLPLHAAARVVPLGRSTVPVVVNVRAPVRFVRDEKRRARTGLFVAALETVAGTVGVVSFDEGAFTGASV